jgi:hypothetical protein
MQDKHFLDMRALASKQMKRKTPASIRSELAKGKIERGAWYINAIKETKKSPQ